MTTNCIIKNNQMSTHNKADENFSGMRRFVARLNFGVGGQKSNPQSLTAYSLNR
jgi:hypothetical protein